MLSKDAIAARLKQSALAIVVAATALLGGRSAVAAPGYEYNTDRPGADYKVESLAPVLGSARGPYHCEALCLADRSKCRAWTFVRAGVRDKWPVCYLKKAAPPPVPDLCCVSGVLPDKSAPGAMREPGVSPIPSTPPVSPTMEQPPVAPAAPGTNPDANEPHGKIGEKYAKLGGPNSGIGPALGGEADAPYGGRCHAFRHGTICWHPAIGEAFTVWGAIHDKWVQFGRVEYGYPITDELTAPDGRGRFNHFRGMQYPGRPEASIYWTPQTGAHAIYGAIREAWAQQGWERGPLGYPTSDEYQDGKYRRVNFERGYIRWAPDTGIETGR